MLERAIEDRRVLSLDYRDEHGNITKREVRPLGLWFWGKVWTLVGWCELREGFRTFRLDRITVVTDAARTFRPERGKQLSDFYRCVELREGNGLS